LSSVKGLREKFHAFRLEVGAFKLKIDRYIGEFYRGKAKSKE